MPRPAPLATPRRKVRPGSLLRDNSDRRLAQRASRGDRRAIATIFERYRQELYSFCLGLLGEPQDAQDALQNTMVKVLRTLPGEEREISLRPWLYRVAHNEAIELRRTRHPTQILDGHLVDGRSSVTERAEHREQLEWLLKDLADLPERQRTVLVMRELSGLDFAEIGAALDTSGAVVRQSLYEARRNLEQMDHGRGLKCEAVTRVLSDADRRITRRRDIRAHLRDCPDCRRFQESIGRRKDVLAGIPPLPAAAAAGVAQALLGGSGGGGTVAALTGGVANSAGVYGALKAAGTIAVVAVVGTAAMQSEMRSTPPGDAAHLQARDDSLPSRAPRRVVAVTAHPGSPSHLFASPADGLPTVPANAGIADGRASSSPVGRGFASEVVLRPVNSSRQAAPAASPPATDFEAAATPGKGMGPSSKPEKNPPRAEKATKSPGQAQKHAEQPGSSSRPEKKDEAEHPQHQGTPPGPAKKETEAEKIPPGQARKQAKAEAAAPAPTPPSPVENEAAADEAEATRPVESPSPNGKAEGHEK
jgi:RNA polymerase sigma factor (sigma-70 family)